MSSLALTPGLWPATTEARIPALLKSAPEDFRVDEVLPFEPTGEGEHLLVRLEKVGIGTPELARVLADAHGIEHVDVGYAGMKDRHAVASQWFSLRGVAALDATVPALGGIRVLGTARHRQKLRRGDLAENRFSILLREPGCGDLDAALETLRTRGAPNYFGAQRFGRDNLGRARDWLSRRRHARLKKFKQGLYLSTLRSYLFNEVLAARVRAGNWTIVIDGDQIDADGRPTAPLWGRGRSATAGLAGRIERAALAPHTALLEGLEHAGLVQARRSLVVRPADLSWAHEDGHLRLEFGLGPGQYATTLLGDAFDLLEPDRRQPQPSVPAATVSAAGEMVAP